MFKNKKFIAAALITVTAAAGIFMFSNTANAGSDELMPESVTVQEMDIVSNVYANGYVSITESRNLKPETKGLVTRLEVAVGDDVTEGQSLAEIDSEELRLALDRKLITLDIEKESLNQTLLQGNTSENAELKRALVSYDQAKDKYESDGALYKSGAVSENAFNDSKNAYEQAKLNLETAQTAINNSSLDSRVKTHRLNIELIESEIEEIKTKIEKQKIISPINGTVTEVNFKKGEMYDESNYVIKVQNFNSKEIKTLISEGEINKLQIGQAVDVTANSIKGQTLKGQVASISPGTTKKEGKNQAYTEVVIKLTESTSLLRDGFLVSLNIQAEKAESVKGVSFEAISRTLDGNATVTKLSSDGSTLNIPVEIGVEGDVFVELITDKINAGDELLIEAGEDLSDSLTDGLL